MALADRTVWASIPAREEHAQRIAELFDRHHSKLVKSLAARTRSWEEARDIASRRLETALARLRGIGVEAEGEVGDERPTYAIQYVLAHRAFDEIIVSTLPPGASRWLKRDLPHRIEVEFGLPVTHLIGTSEPVPRT